MDHQETVSILTEDSGNGVQGTDWDCSAAHPVLTLGMKAPDFLDRNDAYNFFKPLGELVVPGPTFTNVNDFRALLIT